MTSNVVPKSLLQSKPFSMSVRTPCRGRQSNGARRGCSRSRVKMTIPSASTSPPSTSLRWEEKLVRLIQHRGRMKPLLRYVARR